MKCLRFLFSLIRGPPTNKGVFTGFQPRKDALSLFPDHSALVAQLDRAPGSYPGGCRFKSCQAHHKLPDRTANAGVAKLVNAVDLGSAGDNALGVRGPSPAPTLVASHDFEVNAILYLTQSLR